MAGSVGVPGTSATRMRRRNERNMRRERSMFGSKRDAASGPGMGCCMRGSDGVRHSGAGEEACLRESHLFVKIMRHTLAQLVAVAREGEVVNGRTVEGEVLLNDLRSIRRHT